MTIYRENHKEKGNFTQISNAIIEDTRVSEKARMYLIIMLARPDTWKFNMKWLESVIKGKKSALQSGLEELEKFGYLKRKKIRINGRIDYAYEIHENPTEKPQKKTENSEQENKPENETPVKKQSSENQSAENLFTEKRGQKISSQKTASHSNTGNTYTEDNNTDLSRENEEEKAEPARLPHGKHQNVFLSDDEYKTLVETYGKEQTDFSIDTLSDFKKKSGRCKNMNDFRQLMDKWIKKDIEWGKIPKIYSSSEPPKKSESRNNRYNTGRRKNHYDKDFDVDMYTIFVNDY